MVTTTSADSVLKTYYLPVIADQLNKNASPLLARFRRTEMDIYGKDIKKLVRYGINGGISAGTEAGSLPNAGSSHYATLHGTLRNLYGTIEITDKAIRASAHSEGAFVSLLNDEMNGLIRSASFNFGRMLFGDGTGKLATITGSSSNVYYLDSVRNIVEGMVVDVLNTARASVVSARTISNVDYEKKAITLADTVITSPEGFTITVQDSKDLEITGLGAIFKSTGTIYGITRDNSSWFKPIIKTEVGDITEMKVQAAIDEVEERSGSKINFIVCSWGVRRALFNAMANLRAMEPMILEGGFKAVSFNGIPVVADRFCPEGTMYLLNTDDFAIHQLCDWQWLDGEDGKILRQTAGKAIFTATLVKYAELMCYRPAGQAMLSGITEA